MDHVDVMYCGALSSRLERFKVKQNSPYKANFRCPLCGDSQKSKSKCRGWLLEKEGKCFFYCHNCFESWTLYSFLQIYDGALHNQYVVDRVLEKKSSRPKPKPAPVKKSEPPKFKTKMEGAISLATLRRDHPAFPYITKRLIPESVYDEIFYVPKFKKFVNSYLPDKLNEKYEEPRLVFPFYDEDKNLFGFAGRAFDPKAEIKYLTIMLADRRKLYGMHRVDFTKDYYVVEGQIDSLFLPNALAMAGADGKVKGLKNYKNAIGVFDNESRNIQIVRRMQQTLEDGCRVVIWPDDMMENDINDMVMAGYAVPDLVKIMEANTYSGMTGLLKLSEWKNI